MTAAGSHDPLRPVTLDDFAGQDKVVDELRVVLGAAASRGELPPHLLFAGPQGLGKTTLAQIVANEAGLPAVTTSGPMLEKPGDLVSLLVNLSRPSVVFVDEVHRIPKSVEETLYTAMEDGRVDIVVGAGAKARSLQMPLVGFVLVGATTRVGDLGGPFRDRFGHVCKLKPYDDDVLSGIVTRSAGLLQTRLTDTAAGMVASRSRGTPRIANHLLKRVRDYAHHHGKDVVDDDVAAAALRVFGVDSAGLNASDRELLEALCTQFHGGPVGLDTLAAALGEAPSTVSEVHEPYLMRRGLLARTSRGRIATAASWTHLGLTPPAPVDTAGYPGRPVTLPAPGHRDVTASEQLPLG